MTKISKVDRAKMHEHLRELGILGLKANVKHHKVIETISKHTRDVMTMLKAANASNKSLRNIISYRDEEIDELNQKNTDLLWDAAKLEERIAFYEKEKKNDEIEAAQFQKKLVKHYKKESVEN
jgi:hypothetical protein